MPLTVFPVTLLIIDECPNFLKTIVPRAVKISLCALSFVPIQCQSILEAYFHKFVDFFEAIFVILPKIMHL